MKSRHLLVALVALLGAGCGNGQEGLQVLDARIGKPLANTAALYLTIENNTDQTDRLVGVQTSVAGLTELHESATSEDGIVTMNRQGAFEVGAGERLVLEPGGKHVMLLDVDSLEVDDTVNVVLEWEFAGPIEVEATVVPAGLAGRSPDDD